MTHSVPPRLLLNESDMAFRLRAIGALSGAYDVLVPPPGDDPIRFARSVRPDLALLAMGGASRVEGLRLARVLKTDVRSIPALGLYVHAGQDPPARAAVEAVQADGFAVVADVGQLREFVDALAAGGRPYPNPWPTPRLGAVKRLLRRALGS